MTQGDSTDALTFDRILIVVLENQPLRASMRNTMMRDLIKRGTLLSNYNAMVNPSQPNYIGLIAGDLLGVSGDGVYNLPQTNLVDLMDAKNVTWKSYQENYPGNCFAGDTSDGIYKRKHNPFISFDNIRNNPERCAKIVDASELAADIKAGVTPQYSFYTPNMNNNGHDTGLDYAATWLNKTFLPTYMAPYCNTGKSLLVITFDEGVPGDNRIYTLLIGDMIPAGYIDQTSYTHYSLLRLVEENFGLGSLNRHDTNAARITTSSWEEGPAYFTINSGATTLALIVILPATAMIAVAVLSLVLYKRRVTQRRRAQLAEVGTLMSGDEEQFVV
jgi:hypothetical protein